METEENSIRRSMDIQIQIIANKSLKIDMNTHKPPFLPFTFSEWRQDALNALESELNDLSFGDRQNAKRYFINRVDGDLLYHFSKKMKQPYFELVFYDNYAIPKGLDFQAARKDYHLCKNKLFLKNYMWDLPTFNSEFLLFQLRISKTCHASHQIFQYNQLKVKDLEALATQICEWCIQIELSADLVERAELYNYFACEKEEKQIYKDLKEQLQATAGSSVGDKIRGIFKRTLSYSMKSLSNILWSKGIALSNISMGAMILLYYSFIGTSSLPIQILMPKMHLSWLVGGLVGSFALNQVADSIERGEVANNLLKITQIFKEITLNLVDFNDGCENAIKDCTLSRSEEELKQKILQLRKVIRQLLDNAEKLAEIKERVSRLRKIIEKTDDSDDELVLIELDDFSTPQQTDKNN